MSIHVSYRTFADVIAALVAIAVLIAGVALIADDNDVTSPKSTTTVETGEVGVKQGSTNTTVTTRKNGKRVSRVTTEKVQGETPAEPATSTTTTEEGERTFLERILGDGGLVVLQVAVAVLAAFLAGALAQRVLVGEYGGLKLGTSGVELSAVARASTTGIDELKKALKDLRGEAALAEDVKKLKEETQREDGAANRELALLWKQIESIHRQLEQRPPGQ